MNRPTLREQLARAIDEMVEKGIFWPEACAQFEKLFIRRALKESRGKVSDAAELMGVHRNTLSKKLREYGIDRKKL